MACSDEASHAGSVGKLQLTKTETTTNEKPLDEKALDKKPLEKKGVFMQKFALKRKQHSVHPYPATVSKLKLNGYRVEKLPVQEQVDYLNYVGFHHGIDLKSHFKIDPRVNFQRKSHWYLNRALALRQHFVRIIESGYELQWSFADSVIQLWNTTIKPYKRFSGINLKNKESKAYINAVIALSYCLFFKAGSDMGRIKKAILRLPYSRKSNRCPWNWKTNCKLEDFFMMDKENNPLDIYLHPNDDEFRRFCEQYRQRNPKNVKAYDYFKKIYTHEFFTDNEEKGNYICYANEFKIRKFLDSLIDDIRDGANTYDFSLVLPTKSKISGETQPALLHYYLSWLRTNAVSHFNSRAAKFSTILQYDTWDEFVKKFMQIEMGYNDFWKKQDVKRGKGKK